MIGVSLGLNILLRPNNISMQVAAAGAYFILAIVSKDWRLLLQRAILMAAGGMSLLTLKDYVSAGAEIITFLANGLDAAAYAAGDCAAITRAAKKWVDAVAAARQEKK